MPDLHPLFADLPEPIQRGIRDLGWTQPTPVQEKTLPPMREGSDMIVQAHTGSGKTGAFGIPICCAVDPDLDETQALVMVPTRELANQVAEEIAALGRHRGVRCVPIYGGVGYQKQIEAIEAGAHVIVGTPGRILDHLGSRRLHFDRVGILVLDEADEMLSLGFWPDMREIQKYVPKERQSCLFSATIPERVSSLARVFLTDPEYVSPAEGQLAPQQIEHYYVVTTAQEKESNLIRLLEYEEPESAIIFCNTKSDVRFVTAYLQRRGFDADQISGDLTQAAFTGYAESSAIAWGAPFIDDQKRAVVMGGSKQFTGGDAVDPETIYGYYVVNSAGTGLLFAERFDERDEAVKALLAQAIRACRKQGKYVGICGQGPSDHPDLARWLMEQGIESLSLNPDTVVSTWLSLAEPPPPQKASAAA